MTAARYWSDLRGSTSFSFSLVFLWLVCCAHTWRRLPAFSLNRANPCCFVVYYCFLWSSKMRLNVYFPPTTYKKTNGLFFFIIHPPASSSGSIMRNYLFATVLYKFHKMSWKSNQLTALCLAYLLGLILHHLVIGWLPRSSIKSFSWSLGGWQSSELQRWAILLIRRKPRTISTCSSPSGKAS